ncbi:MAG: DUF2270 domain-containing protein [Kiritimatiellia bacterium]
MSTTESATIPMDPKDYYTVMSHFYRGEVGRIMLWRQRLDLTTNWAIAASTGIITYALSHVEVSHLVFFFANIICLFLLIIESRRYRYYDAFRARVRMLEAHFLRPVVQQQSSRDEINWREQLAEDLALPSFKISRREALFRRFGRNYVWLFLIIGGAWFVKVWAHCPGAQVVGGFLSAVQNGQPLPRWLFWTLGVLFLGAMAWLLQGALRLKSYTAESDIGQVHKRAWQV